MNTLREGYKAKRFFFKGTIKIDKFVGSSMKQSRENMISILKSEDYIILK